MRRILNRNGRDGSGGHVSPGDHDCLNILRDDCVAELHEASALPNALHHFLPLGCEISLRCHADDKFGGGQKQIVISDPVIHSILATGPNEWTPLFANFKESPVPAAPAPAETQVEVDENGDD